MEKQPRCDDYFSIEFGKKVFLFRIKIGIEWMLHILQIYLCMQITIDEMDVWQLRIWQEVHLPEIDLEPNHFYFIECRSPSRNKQMFCI